MRALGVILSALTSWAALVLALQPVYGDAAGLGALVPVTVGKETAARPARPERPGPSDARRSWSS
jgi:hypothetical protein